MSTNTVTKTVICPGCGASVELSTRCYSAYGPKELIIRAHNPLPDNVQGADPHELCPASECLVDVNEPLVG